MNAISGVSVAVREKRGHARTIEASASGKRGGRERRERGERGASVSVALDEWMGKRVGVVDHIYMFESECWRRRRGGGGAENTVLNARVHLGHY